MPQQQIQRLLVISGPGGIGKNTVYERFASADFAPLRAALRIEDLDAWPLYTPHTLNQHAGQLPGELVLHYEMSRLITRPGYQLTDFDRDPELEVLGRASELLILTLWASPAIAARRLRGRLPLGSRIRQVFRPERRYLATRRLYADPQAFKRFYLAWLDYCDSVDAHVHLVADISEAAPRLVGMTEFRESLAGGGNQPHP
jgi:hypothetical protein